MFLLLSFISYLNFQEEANYSSISDNLRTKFAMK